jgi:hypothetical protein
MNLTDAYMVVLVEKFAWRRSKKDRPAIVIALVGKGDNVNAFPSTTQEDLCINDHYFSILSDDPQFGETGLRLSSYIVDEMVDIPMSQIVGPPLGFIGGDLKRRLDAEFGL